jgi:hypothetical protein
MENITTNENACTIIDGAYVSKKNFMYLSDNGIEAAIKVRRSSSGKANGCYTRKLVVIKQLSDFEKWKSSVSYGYRWIAESVFSAMKRMFGEYGVQEVTRTGHDNAEIVRYLSIYQSS